MSGLHFNSECKAYKHFFLLNVFLHIGILNPDSESPNTWAVFLVEHVGLLMT